VQFTVKREGKRYMGLFASSESPNKLILVPDQRKRDALFIVMESQHKDSGTFRLPSSRYLSSNIN